MAEGRKSVTPIRLTDHALRKHEDGAQDSPGLLCRDQGSPHATRLSVIVPSDRPVRIPQSVLRGLALAPDPQREDMRSSRRRGQDPLRRHADVRRFRQQPAARVHRNDGKHDREGDLSDDQQRPHAADPQAAAARAGFAEARDESPSHLQRGQHAGDDRGTERWYATCAVRSRRCRTSAA